MVTNRRINYILISLAILGLFLVWPLPSSIFKVPYSTVVTAENGDLLAAKIADDGQWRFPPDKAIPERFKTCLLLFEDEHFFNHPGVNPLSIGRAIVQNIKSQKVVSGGSTITMQLARMINQGSARSIGNKLLEILLAFKIELFYTKSEILNIYASHAPFGGNVVGLEAAAWRYYKRFPDQLSWAEAATLAVLPNSPSMIYPGKGQTKLKNKRDRLLFKLKERGIISKSDYVLFSAEPLPGKPNGLPDDAKHLLTRIISEGDGGKHIETTLNAELQKNVLNKIAHHHNKLKSNHIYNAAAIVVEVESGKVLAYVGNTNSSSIHSPDVDIIIAPRSTGSILKPFLYGLAIEEGILTPHQLLPDVPTFFQGFAPKNFDDSFEGAVEASEALRKSLNVPFVYLLRDYSYEKFHRDLGTLGISTLNKAPGHYGLSLILGGAEASLWDLTSAYSGLARTVNAYYTKMPDQDYRAGKIYSNTFRTGADTNKGKPSVVSAGAGYLMFEAMQQLQRPEEMSGWFQFASSRKIAWKTGTSYGFRDAWAIGTDGKYVVGVWAGNADGEGRPGLTGIEAGAPLMFDIFGLLPKTTNFLKGPPSEMKTMKVCPESGSLAGKDCPNAIDMPLVVKSTSAPVCQYHVLIHLDESMQYQVNTDCYPLHQIITVPWFKLPPVQEWYYKFHHSDYNILPNLKPGCVSEDNASRVMEMIYPTASSKIYVPVELDGKPGRCVFELAHIDRSSVVYWHIDEQYIGQTSGSHSLSLNPDFGKHTLRAVDQSGNELVLPFEILNEK